MLQEFGEYELEISYRQISIFNKGLENPFNDWTMDHVAQGFTLRNGSIGIMTISQNGGIKVKVTTDPHILDKAVRIYVFPFNVKGGIEIATITAGVSIPIKDGFYTLLVQIGNTTVDQDWCCIGFISPKILDSTPRIIKSDSEITKKDNLLLTATPA